MFLARTRAWLKRQHDQHKACVYETLAEYVKHHKALDKKKAAKAVFAKKYWGWWILLAVVIGLSVALSTYHDKIALAIRPAAEKIRNTKGAWAAPVGALIITSIPPLMGAEIIILVVGIIWDLWFGFLIACIGTFLGEILCYYLFKYTIRDRARRIEESSRLYAGLANIMRRDGLWMISLVRFSALPGHITTAIQSTIGISVWIFGIACAISLPKQLVLVYLGVLFGQSQLNGEERALTEAEAASKRKHTAVTWIVLMLTGFLTVVAMYVIWFRMWQVEKAQAAAKAAALELEEVDKETASLDENLRFTLPYHVNTSTGSSDATGARRDDGSSTYASTSTLVAPTIHSLGGKPKLGRTRSSTFSTLAMSNGTMPYLSYTPMLEMPTSAHGIQLAPPRDMPSPVPSAVLSFASQTDTTTKDESPYFASSSGAQAQAALEANKPLRRMNFERTDSDIILPSAAAQTHTERVSEPSTERGAAVQETAAPEEAVSSAFAPLERVVSYSDSRHSRTQSRASSYLSASSTIHGQSRH